MVSRDLTKISYCEIMIHLGSDLSASPKCNKPNGRKIQKENTQGKQLRRNGNNNNHKQQRNNSNYQTNNSNVMVQQGNDYSRVS